MTPSPLATYRRRVGASLARVWENVLDWEHLPWLHAGTFAAITLRERRADGWRATVALHGGSPFELDVAIDRTTGVYHSRTLSGPGAGTDIVTRLTAVDARHTDVAVAFHVPHVDPTTADRLADGYVALYTRLWDEDEWMMRRRHAMLDAGPVAASSARIDLGPRAALGAGRVVETPAGAVCVRRDGERLLAHAASCPHWGGPLDDAPLTNGCVRCPWHGYAFDVASGVSADGRGFRLVPRVHVEDDGDRCTLVVGD